jgi:hypothetical protein
MTTHEAYLAKLVAGGALTDKEATDLLKLYDRARAEIHTVGKALTRQETVAIYNRYKLHPSEDELIAINPLNESGDEGDMLAR